MCIKLYTIQNTNSMGCSESGIYEDNYIKYFGEKLTLKSLMSLS